MRNSILLCLLLFLSCSSPTDVSSGSSTSVGNPIVIGTVSDGDSLLSNAAIFVLPKSFIPTEDYSYDTIFTNSEGFFTTKVSDTGAYRITVLSDNNKQGALLDTTLFDTVTVSIKTNPLGVLQVADSTGTIIVPGTPLIGKQNLSVPTFDTLTIFTQKGSQSDTISNIEITTDTTFVRDSVVWHIEVPPTQYTAVTPINSIITNSDKKLFIIGNNTIKFRNSSNKWTQKKYEGVNFHSVITTQDNTLWITSDQGLISYSTGGFKQYKKETSDLYSDTTSTITARNNSIALVAEPNTLQTITKGVFEHYVLDSITDTITAIEYLTDTTIAIGTNNGNMWIYTLTTNECHKPTALEGIVPENNAITSLLTVGDSTLWIAAESKLIAFDIAMQNVAYTTESKSSRFINTVYDEESDKVWLSSDNGLFYVKDKKLYSLELTPVVTTIIGNGDSPKYLLAESDQGIIALKVLP